MPVNVNLRDLEPPDFGEINMSEENTNLSQTERCANRFANAIATEIDQHSNGIFIDEMPQISSVFSITSPIEPDRSVINTTIESIVQSRLNNSFSEYIEKEEKDKKTLCVCSICGTRKKTIEVPFVRYSLKICVDCDKKYIGKCRKCSKNYPVDRLFDLDGNGKFYCCNCLYSSGYRICHNCKRWTDCTVQINNNYSYCPDCLKKLSIETFCCRSCGRTYLMDRYGKNSYCITCINAELREVRNYSYKPEPRFFHVNTEFDNMYFGVELEMGYVADPSLVNDFVAEYSNSFFYMKKDTSIPIYGCEIVTQPATLTKHLRSKYWRALLDAAKESGFNANNDKCGIHVHVSKNAFTSDEISALDCFVNSYDFWKKIARRESHYSAYIQKDDDSWGRQTTNRRCALNLSNTNTIEFRIFKGTLEYEEVMAYLEVCHAASMFVKKFQLNFFDTSEDNKKHITKTFFNFIKNEKYFYLNKYVKKFKIFR